MNKRPSNRSAFTIVEILVVVALILILLSILIVAVNAATRTAQRTNTQALMNSMKTSLMQFKEDVGYLPPVLRPNRDLSWQFASEVEPSLGGPDPTRSQFQQDIQDWYSITTLAEYLIGYGDYDEDGAGPNNPDATSDPLLGIRHPGPDGYWGASVSLGLSGSPPDAPGTFAYRRFALADSFSANQRQGRILGPYLQLRDDRLLGSIDPSDQPDANGRWRVYFPGEEGYNGPGHALVIVDYWGEPIRYYRRPYPDGGISRGYRLVRGGAVDEVPTLADVYLLRPWNVGRSEVQSRFADGRGDTTATFALQSSEFALFSSGPDRRHNAQIAVDDVEDNVNQDNIVELSQ